MSIHIPAASKDPATAALKAMPICLMVKLYVRLRTTGMEMKKEKRTPKLNPRYRLVRIVIGSETIIIKGLMTVMRAMAGMVVPLSAGISL